jgi:shikimate dehydrogenase
MSQGADDNPTVAVVESAFTHSGLDWRYVNMEVAPSDLGAAVAGARAMGFRGFNLSMPHKETVIAHLDGLAPSAAIIRAVNCVVREGNRLIGHNTDGQGFVESLRPVADPAGRHVAVIGAGGAARAVAVELALAGARRITIANRTLSRADDIAAVIRQECGVEAEAHATGATWQVPDDCDVVVNATSVGLSAPDALPPVDLDSLRAGQVVADVVFEPADTRLLRSARERGCVTVDGLGMLAVQAAAAIRLWTGIEPDLAVMRDALSAALSQIWE